MKRFVLKLLSAGVPLLAFSPAFVLLGKGLLPDAAPFAWLLLPLPGVVLAVAAGLVPGSRRVLCAILLGALYIGGLVWVLPVGLPLLLILPCLALYWMILRAFATPPFEEWTPAHLVTGVLLHTVALGVYSMRPPGPALAWVRWLALVNVPVSLLYANHLALVGNASARDGRKPPRRMVRANLLWVALLSGVVLLLAQREAVRAALGRALDWLRRGFLAFLRLLGSLFSSVEVDSGGPLPEEALMPGMDEAAETSLLWMILERVMIGVAIALAVVLAFFAFRFLWRRLRRLLRALSLRMREAQQRLSAGVQESSESLLDWQQVRTQAGKRLRNTFRRLRPGPRWRDMDARDRVRFVYAQWSARHPGLSQSATAREALPTQQAADLYEQARYSDLPVDAQQAQEMRDQLL